MKKILFFIHDLGNGGAEKVLVNLVNNMDRSKFDITVMSLFGGGVNEQFLKPHIRYIKIFKRELPANSKIMKLFSPKFLHKFCIKDTYDIEVSYLEGPAARIISGCKNSITKLVSWIHVQQESKAVAAAAFRNYSEARSCYEKFDNTVCVSEYVKRNFIENFDFKNRVEVLYNTNETNKIIELSNEVVEDYDFTTKTIIAIGTLKKSKGFDKLIRIHKRLIDDGIKHNVIGLGVGPEEENLKKLVRENNSSDTFKLLGYRKNPYKYLKNSDLFVCSSSAEGFSTATTESLIVSTPICTFDVSGMKEMLGENDEYGIVTENNEDALYKGIKKMLTTPNMLENYAEKALERGKKFSTEKTVKAVEEMLLSL